MSLNSTPSASRMHIGFFGLRNAGKSSLVNAVTNQDLAVVSAKKGTTTDPVLKAMELLPIGPVVIIDTPGFDDEGELGSLRVKKTKQILNRSDLAVLVVDAIEGIKAADQQLIDLFVEKTIPYIIAYNKADLLEDVPEADEHSIYVSAITKMHVHELKEMIAHLGQHHEERVLVGDLVKPGDQVILVIPIDESAPKGRIILPQQLVLRDLLDHQAAAICCQVETLKATLDNMKEPPALVITDSQAFHRVAAIVPEDILLTSFSILMARFKGSLETTIKGLAALDHLEDGDVILIAEGCTHHRQCNDIGTVKIPRWLKAYTHKELKIETSSGLSFPEDLSRYAMIIHCGGCMLNEREVTYRMKCARDSQVPITNYGMAIAHFNGILKRSLRIFPNLLAELDNE